MSIYATALIGSLIINIGLFIPAFLFKTDKLTDFSYGLSFFLLSTYLFYLSDKTIFDLILFVMISIWAFRIAVYLLQRILKTKKDRRFDGIRENFWKFFGFWILQAISVWLILFAAISFWSTPKVFINYTPLILGAFIAFLGILIETIADMQKFKFKNLSENNNFWIQTGLWKYSRHPNYFGEILVWVGICIFSLSSSNGLFYIINIVSPFYIFILLRFVSGIPILEKKYDEKYADSKDYLEYKKGTNLLFLWPSSKKQSHN